MTAAHRGHRLSVVEAVRPPPPQIRWEYRRMAMLPHAEADLASLNAAGAEGWEVVHSADLYRSYLMKRRVRE